jgi:hypothetical protein
MPNLPPESASKRPSPEALRCPSGQASVTKKTRSIYKELNGNVVRDRAENCPCKNRVTVETATTTAMGGAPHRPASTFALPEMANRRPPSETLRCRTRQSIAPVAAENLPSSPTDDPPRMMWIRPPHHQAWIIVALLSLAMISRGMRRTIRQASITYSLPPPHASPSVSASAHLPS